MDDPVAPWDFRHAGKPKRADSVPAPAKMPPSYSLFGNFSRASDTQGETEADAGATESGETVYVTRTGNKYHRAGCSSLSKSAIPMDRSSAERRYGPCARCNP